MTNRMESTTPIWQLTVSEFIELVDKTVSASMRRHSDEFQCREEPADTRYVYGLKGLSSLLGVSVSKTAALKRSGLFDKAIHQNGRSFVVDADMAIRLFGENEDKRKTYRKRK